MLTSVMTKPAVPAKSSKRPLPLGKHHPLRKLGFQSAQVMTGAQLGDGKCQHGAPTHPELHRLLHLISNRLFGWRATPARSERTHPRGCLDRRAEGWVGSKREYSL